MASVETSIPVEVVDSTTNEDGLNMFDVCCPRCSSVILRKNAAKLVKKERSLPVYARKTELDTHSGDFPTDTLDQFWTVNDMFTFENVGFTRDVDSVRYLTCADCELGPIGYHDTKEGPPTVYYIALKRTSHKSSETAKDNT
ncbi:unnamed protein product [Calicophoron daubneyi]|uniref:Guanine nucleotide exchange factor MSS4 n=1 Tax=Calicophoron daubneyi TaxID=300641 RepID=A0AAV2TC33_CALDB